MTFDQLRAWLKTLSIDDAFNIAQCDDDTFMFDTNYRDHDIYKILKGAGCRFVHTSMDHGIVTATFKVAQVK